MKPTVLVAAHSGRAIAQSLVRGGYKPIVADCFGDEDLFAVTENWSRLKVDGNFNVDANAAIQTLRALSASENTNALVLGSGFEGDKSLLAALANEFDLIGNSVETIMSCKGPRVFFPLLDSLNILHPDISQEIPENVQGWLAKPVGRSGGRGISVARPDSDGGVDTYFQRRVEGTPMSILFITNGMEVEIIGVNRLLLNPTGDNPYLYGGVIGPCSISDLVLKQLREDVIAVAGALELRGLNSVDFMLSSDCAYWIEINPRPPASFELYETRDRSMLDWHVRVCQGELPPGLRGAETPTKGIKVAYTPTSLTAPPIEFWPPWCRDLPMSGQLLKAGAPICTVSATGKDCKLAEIRLKDHERDLFVLLDDAAHR